MQPGCSSELSGVKTSEAQLIFIKVIITLISYLSCKLGVLLCNLFLKTISSLYFWFYM